MKTPNLHIKKKVIIAESAIFNGLEKTVAYYNIKESLVLKWVENIDKLKEKAKLRIERDCQLSKEWYAEKSLEDKKKRNKYKAEVIKKYRKKHSFLTLIKNLKKNLKQKGYNHEINFNPFDLWIKAKRQKCLCAISGIRLTPDNISIDHIIPLSKGGTSELSNLQLVDKQVNNMKLNYDLENFLKILKKILDFQSRCGKV